MYAAGASGGGQQGFPSNSNWDDPQDRNRTGSQHGHQTSAASATINNNTSHHSLSADDGRLVIKVRLGTDVRRIPLNNEDLTYVSFNL